MLSRTVVCDHTTLMLRRGYLLIFVLVQPIVKVAGQNISR